MTLLETHQEQETKPTFAALPLDPATRKAIDDAGWLEPTPVQVASYAPAVEGHDLIVQARTGTGKTAAFGIPLVDRLVTPGEGMQALILAPTRELALQSAREIEWLGAGREVRTVAVYGGASMEKQIRELNAGHEVISGTPGRVLDHIRRGSIDGTKIRILVLDEADEMLSMGFAKELNAIMSELAPKRQTLLYSATVDGAVKRIGERHMRDPEFLALSGDEVGATTIHHAYYMVTGSLGKALVRVMNQEDPESAIIFCNTKAETSAVAGLLERSGYKAAWINGDLAQSDREKAMNALRQGDKRFLVATDVAARGIDISHVTHVFNFGFPNHVEQYIHRTGRTGRAGRTGTAISIVGPQDLGSLYYLRLTYKLSPQQRSLPDAQAEKAQAEVGRIALLEEAYDGVPAELPQKVAKRLLSHPRAESIMAGLIAAFFGDKPQEEIDAAGAKKVRSRKGKPAPAPEAKAEARASEGKPKSKERQRTRRRRDASKEAPATDKEAKATAEAKPASEAKPKDEAKAQPAAPADTPAKAETPRPAVDENTAVLYLNVGRRDGLQVGEVLVACTEGTGIERGDVGKIRIRDKHTFVAIPKEHSDGLIEALTGKELQGRELVVELARNQG